MFLLLIYNCYNCTMMFVLKKPIFRYPVHILKFCCTLSIKIRGKGRGV